MMSDNTIPISSRSGPMEKVGHAVLRKFGPSCPDGMSSVEDQSVLTEEEQQKLKNIVRWTVFRAGLIGAFSAAVSACAAIYAGRNFADDSIDYWLVFGGVALVTALIEVGYLYYDALRAVHRISGASDVELFPQGESRSRMAGIMVRAAMELPNPPDRDPYVNPFRQASKLRIMMGALLYKGKIMLTNALLKVLVRKILLRGVARVWLEFLAVPVTAAWNALVCFWVLREARIRAMGPSAVAESLPKWLAGSSSALADAAQRAVGVCVSASRDLHPNHLFMLEWMRQHHGMHVSEQVDDEVAFYQSILKLSEEEKGKLKKILAMAIVIDGKVSRRECKIMQQLENTDPTPMLRKLVLHFRRGCGIQ